MLLSLSGCSGIYSNFRELERLLVIQTMGIDYAEEGVGISLASGAKSDGSSPVRLFSPGVSVTSAVAHILSYSQEQELFLSHTSHVVLGEEAAKNGINGYLSYICRSPNLRTDIPLYIVKGGTAQEAVMQVGDGSKGISEVLEAVRANVDERGDSKAFSASDLLRDLERNGSGLVCAIECSPSIQEGGTKQEGGSGSSSGTDSAESPDSTGGSGSGEEKQEKQALTAAAVGYGVIRGDRLCAYIDKEQAIGVGLLLNIVGISDIVVKDRYATPVTLELDQGSSVIKPVWAEDGSLEMLDIQIKAAANIAEIGGGGHFGEPDYEDYLTAQLETAVSERVSSVIQLSKTLQADFLGLGNIVEMDDAEKYRALGGDFASLLPGLTVRISVSGQIKHTNDIRDEKA
ncbi:MAG: Ger(x)C family spore germination C-terminal domain-containing protein [Candidatus Limivicinus sp.]|nr:Ger(x)C family spore germination C-terminal domain-containing protein [Clostridiales bacterium]MDY6133174.1 Ger(x)C family spore germination C-terminal domain-containing protein [Candidatus Limivicinus sp.]